MLDRFVNLGKTLTSAQGMLQLAKQKTTLAGAVVLLLMWGVDVDELQSLIDSTMKIVLSVGALGAVLWDEAEGKSGDAE
jgi:hypothetical protein